jgi:hypothetical protein
MTASKGLFLSICFFLWFYPLVVFGWSDAARSLSFLQPSKFTQKHDFKPSTPLFQYLPEEQDTQDGDGWDDLHQEQKALSTTGEETERDLFIPIFAVVSLVGLFGSYAYEIIRLASRGELYFPWSA